MNDIDILEEFIENYKKVQEKYKDDEIQAEIERSCYFEEVPYQAISTLIAENKELKEKELDYTTIYLSGIYDERDKWHKKIKEMIEELEEDDKYYIKANMLADSRATSRIIECLQEILDERNNTDEN